ncbi:MAG TPA: hypothetical protein VJA25_03730, partial [Dehalococcoidia bacterium]|nr:hypothetical protein [Dehalococcoidia bacterium]
PEVRGLVWRYGLTLPELGQEGYVIQPLLQAKPPGILVVGGSALGIAYGLLALAEDLRLERTYLQYPLPVHREPAMELRLAADPLEPGYPGAEQALKWGFNAVMIEPWPTLAMYERLDPAIYDPARYGAERAWVAEQRRRAREQIAQAKSLHLKVIAPGDVISFPTQFMKLYGERVSDGGTPPRYCIERITVREALATALDEVLEEFPEIDGIMVRTGENYPVGPVLGNIPQSAQCSNPRDSLDSVAKTLGFLQEQVVQKHHRLLIQRAWDLGSEGVHAQPVLAQRLASVTPEAVAPVFSFKISQTDFWRYAPLNPNLLEQTIPRMVEMQAAREFEGKGAFPNYVAGLYALGMPESTSRGGLRVAYSAGVRNAWVWPKGGGWDGPHLESDLWLNANVYALSRLLWEPYADPTSLAADWARLRYGDAAAPKIVALLEKSPSAVLKGLYLDCYAVRNGAWAPNDLWVRDDIITGGDRVEALYRSCSSEPDFSHALAEKRQAVALVDAMLDDFWQVESLIPDRELARQTLVDLLYERSLFRSLQYYLEGMFNYYRFRDSGGRDEGAKTAALGAFTKLNESWQDHTQVVASLPGAATPYRDAGMLSTAEEALHSLGAW